MPAIDNPTISFTAGDLIDLDFTVLDGDGVGALDLTNFDLRWALTQGTTTTYDTEPLVEKSTDNVAQLEKTDATNGVARVKLTGVDTKDLDPGSYYWELEVADINNEKIVVAYGGIDLRSNVVNALIPTTVAP